MTVAESAAIFEAARPRLRALAYRMLGSLEDAEDVVQETFVRWHAVPQDEIASPDAWLTRVCTRLCLDALRAAYRARESYVGPWLPEPVLTSNADEVPDPAELAESLSMAFLLLLERLSPLERAAFLLHDIFGYGYPEIAQITARSEAACRQLVSRARRSVRREQTRFPSAPEQATALLEHFLAATRAGEVQQLVTMLGEEVELWSDGGGEVTAARNVIRGAEPVARFLVGVARKGGGLKVRPAWVNGTPGVVLAHEEQATAVLTVAMDEAGKVQRIFLVVSPRKLRRVQVPPEGGVM